MRHSTYINKKNKIKKRQNISYSKRYRIIVYKSNKYLNTIFIDNSTNKIVFSISSASIADTDLTLCQKIEVLSKNFAEKLTSYSDGDIYFDRTVYRYHGIIKKFVEGLRLNGVVV